jgi:F0F1-type ATP synthase membrane subunit b/b'
MLRRKTKRKINHHRVKRKEENDNPIGTMAINGINLQVIELIAAVLGVMLVALGIVLKIFWDNIKTLKRDIADKIRTLNQRNDKQDKHLEDLETFMEKSFEELKVLHAENIRTNMDTSSKLTIAITKINTTLEHVIKRQDKHEDEIDKLKEKK